MIPTRLPLHSRRPRLGGAENPLYVVDYLPGRREPSALRVFVEVVALLFLMRTALHLAVILFCR